MKRETENPLKALEDESIHVRAAATRDLEKFGGVEDIDILLEHAGEDSSIAIRLNAADAASDILSRRRLIEPSLTRSEQLRIIKKIVRVDPRKNNAIYLVFASLGSVLALEHIIKGLKSPHSEVRLGAGVGLQRFVISYRTLGDLTIESMIVDCFQDKSMTADALAFIAQACAAAGYRSALAQLRRIDLEGKHGDTIAMVQERLRSLHKQPFGIWISDGRDAGEVNPRPQLKKAICAISASGVSIYDGTEWSFAGPLNQMAHRQLWFRRVGDGVVSEALQLQKRTWYPAKRKEVIGLLRTHSTFGEFSPGMLQLGEAVEHILGDWDWKAKDYRELGLIYFRAHAFDLAIRVFDQSIASKRTPIDCWIFKGDVLFLLERYEEARDIWEISLSKVRSQTSAIAQLARSKLAQLDELSKSLNKEELPEAIEVQDEQIEEGNGSTDEA